MRTLKTALCTLAIAVSAVAVAQTRGARPVDPTGLKDAYKDYFKVGVAINNRNLQTPEEMALVKKEFNSITAENCMKPGELHPQEDVWNWEQADAIANFCRENNIPLRGHNLFWHSQGCTWMYTDKDGKPASKELFYARLENHIKTVVERYNDIVYCWDVVNEAMADGDGRPTRQNGQMVEPSPYRQSQAYQMFGDEFIAKCFEFAAKYAKPGVQLFYNDYNAADPAKRDRIYNMVKKMKEVYGVRVDGIGMQGHYNIYGPSEADIDAAITKYATLVDHIQFTEVDIRANEEMGGQLRFSRGENLQVKPYIRSMHTAQYNMLFRVLRKHKDVIDVVTFWNVSDKDSWVGTANYPLLFDAQLNRKEAYTAVKNFDPALDNAIVKEDFVPSSFNAPGQQYPMVNSQGYARFRVEAPQAKSVIVSLGLGGHGGTVLHKGDDGFWTGTTEAPMDEGFHYYHLTVDGGVMNDPGTGFFFGSCRWESGIEIPTYKSKDEAFYAEKNIPHGNIDKVLFWSESTKSLKVAHVYTPAGYDSSKKTKYPVLYLQHGWGENETSWPVQGKAGIIMDNMINEGRVDPFIVVMTYGMTNDVQIGRAGGFTSQEFETVLVDELVPYIDAHYRTKADKAHRAMAGLSMGGMETHAITLRRPEVFGYWGLLSGGTYTPEELAGTGVKGVFMGCGAKENPDSVNKAAADCKAAGFNAMSYVSPDTAHEFLTWRRCLYQMAPMLFK